MMVMKSKQKIKKTPLENITLGKEEIKKPRTKQERLEAGETFVTSEKGNSMVLKILIYDNKINDYAKIYN